MINSHQEDGRREANDSQLPDEAGASPARRSKTGRGLRSGAAGVGKSLAAGVARAQHEARRAAAGGVKDKLAAGGPARRSGVDAVKRGRTTGSNVAGPVDHVADKAKSASKGAPRQMSTATKAVSDGGRVTAGAADSTTRQATGGALQVGASVTKGALGVVGSTLRVVGSAAFSFLIGKALLLLELIKRLGRAALNTVQTLLARLQNAAESRRRP